MDDATSDRGIAKTRDQALTTATELDRQRGAKRVRHKIASRIASPTKIDKNFPMTRAQTEKVHLFTRTKVFQKIERLSQWRRFFENPWMRDHAQAVTQCHFRYGDSSRIAEGCFQ